MFSFIYDFSPFVYSIFNDIIISIFFITILYFFIGLIFRYFGGRTINQYSPLDLITMLIFAGLIENAIMFAVNYVSFISIVFSAVYIVLFNYFITDTSFYKKLFPINRILLVKNGIIDKVNLKKVNLSIEYLWVELRKANVINLIQVKEVFLEPNSAISVLQITESHVDPVTGLSFHWSSSKDWVSKLFKSGSTSVSLISIDFKNTGKMNDIHGRLLVNKALKEAADILLSTVRYDDRCFRFDEDRFLIIVNSGKENIDKVVQNIEMKLSILETIKGYSFDIYVSMIDEEDDFDDSVKELERSIETYKDDESEGFIKVRYLYDHLTVKENDIKKTKSNSDDFVRL